MCILRHRLFLIAVSVVYVANWQLGSAIDDRLLKKQNNIQSKFLALQIVAIAIAPRELYFWDPTTSDLPAGGSSVEEFLYYLLTHADSKTYAAKPGDSVDRILRNQFFVSGSLHPRAYRLYFREIVRRNALHPPYKLRFADELNIPVGPHYSALEAPISSEDVYLHRAIQVFDARLATVSTSPSEIRRRLYHAVGRYSWMFPSPVSGWPVVYIRRHGIQEIIDRRILPAGKLNPLLEREQVLTYEWSPLPASAGNVTKAPGFLIQSDTNPDGCGSRCTSCSALLKITKIAEMQHPSRLLIVDTGVDPAAMAEVVDQIFYLPKDLVNGKPLDSSDSSSIKHGTFVYTEAVNTFRGPLDPKDVFVSKIAVPLKERPDYFVLSMDDAIKAFVNYGETRDQLAGTPDRLPVWVVNLSMYGSMANESKNVTMVTGSEKVLYVAAAGNGGSHLNMDKDVYTRFDNGNSNVLIVGALDGASEEKQKIAYYSNRSERYVDLFAQGSCVCGNAKTFGPAADLANQINGTSQAAPVVAVAAKILAENFPAWDAQQVKWRLISTTDLNLDSLERMTTSGNREHMSKGGRLNFPRALNNKFDESLLVTSKSSLDQSVKYIDPSTGGWSKLLAKRNDQDQDVLRIHQVECSKPGKVCFEVIRFEDDEFSKDLVDIGAGEKLLYRPIGGEIKFIEAKQVRELIQPMSPH